MRPLHFFANSNDSDRWFAQRERAVRDYVQARQENLERNLSTAEPAAKLRRLNAQKRGKARVSDSVSRLMQHRRIEFLLLHGADVSSNRATPVFAV